MTTETFLNHKYSLQNLLSHILQCINLQKQPEHKNNYQRNHNMNESELNQIINVI